MKPQPPADLWAQLGKALEEIGHVSQKPEGGFTRDEFASKFSITADQAYSRLQKLQRAGKIKRYGSSGRNVYYMMV